MNVRKKVDLILSRTLVLIMAAMVINVLWQVFTRKVVGIPSSFTDELARYLMIWVGVLGAAYVAGKNMHVAIDLLPSKFSIKTQQRFMVIVNVLIILFTLTAFVIGGIRLVYISYILGQHSPALNIPLAIVYLVIPISGFLIIYYKTLDILKKS